jgi:hypothetical protein
MTQQNCQWCNTLIIPIDVHGHYQCPNCKINIDPCCSGEHNDDYDTTLQSCNTKRFDE